MGHSSTIVAVVLIVLMASWVSGNPDYKLVDYDDCVPYTQAEITSRYTSCAEVAKAILNKDPCFCFDLFYWLHRVQSPSGVWKCIDRQGLCKLHLTYWPTSRINFRFERLGNQVVFPPEHEAAEWCASH